MVFLWFSYGYNVITSILYIPGPPGPDPSEELLLVFLSLGAFFLRRGTGEMRMGFNISW